LKHLRSEGRSVLPESAKAVVLSEALAHLSTLNESGSIHVTLAWTGLEDGEVVIATIPDQKKLWNMRRDPRVTVSWETEDINDWGLREYLVIKGRARVTEGGAPELLQELAYTYIGPGVKFPPMPDSPPGFVTRISIDHIGGVGPWMSERE
jgi:PPOX class probable F420-dependent enzyme